MSHYARIVKVIEGRILGMPAKLPVGVEIKRVKLTADSNGGYECLALVSHKADEWTRFVTYSDLPAYTDKGREHRANGCKRPTLAKGRPNGTTKSNAPPTKAGGLRMRPDQWAALDAWRELRGKSRNEAVIEGLALAGLVPR